MWHQDDVSMSKQEDKEIAENIMLWSDDIFEDWGKNEIRVQCVWWHYCRRKMWHIIQSREIFINYNFKLNALLSSESLTNQLCSEDSVLWC